MHCNITKYSQLVLTSDAEILQSYAKLDAKKSQCTKAEFDMWQQATGWNHSSKALLLDQDLKPMGQWRPRSQFAHDYMHSILQGVAPIVLYQWLCAMEEGFQVWSGLEAYFQFWVFPRAWKCQHVGTYFSKKKMTSHKNNQKISVQASECLAIYPIVRQFVYNVALPNGLQAPACQALLAMASLIGQVHDGNLAGIISKGTLLPAIELAIQCFQAAFPEVSLIKKWHWLLHMPDTTHQRVGFLPSCFANERKHKPIGQLATSLLNKKNFETNLLEQALAKEICHLDQPQLFKDGVHLVDPISASKKSLQTLSNLIGEPIGEAQSSQCAKVNHMSCFKDDTVIYQAGESMGIAEIQLHFLLHDVATTLVKSWLVKEWLPHKQCAICQVLDHNLGFVPTADIIAPVICHKSTGTAKVLLPYPIYSEMLKKSIQSMRWLVLSF